MEREAGAITSEITSISLKTSDTAIHYVGILGPVRLLTGPFCILNVTVSAVAVGEKKTDSYFVSTVGGAPLDVIKQYVERQKQV